MFRRSRIDHLPFTTGQQKSLKQFSMPYPEQIAECAFVTKEEIQGEVKREVKGEISSNLVSYLNLSCHFHLIQELIAITRDGHYYYFVSDLGQRPQGYELILNLSFDQEFWKI